MTNTFEFDQYAVVLSLNEKTIYIKITDTHSYIGYEGHITLDNIQITIIQSDTFYMCYENQFDSHDISVLFNVNDIYSIIENSFKRDDDKYSVEIHIDNGTMKLIFNMVVRLCLHIKITILIQNNNLVSTHSHILSTNPNCGIPTYTQMERSINNNEFKNIQNEEPICLFNFEEMCRCYLPILPYYSDKTKLE